MLLLPLLAAGTAASAAQLSGSVKLFADSPFPGSVRVAAFRLSTDPVTGTAVPLSKRLLLGAETVGEQPPQHFEAEAAPAGQSGVWSYSIDVPAGNYTVMAFEPGANGWLDFSRPQLLGFHVAPDGCCTGCGSEAYSDAACAEILTVPQGGAVSAAVELRAPRMMPTDGDVSVGAAGGGHLHRVSGIPVLHVWGNASERGYAHGYMLAEQIIDMVDLFLIEDMVRSRALYEDHFLPALRAKAKYSPQFSAGVQGVLAGIRARLPDPRLSLGRPISAEDIVALNTYADSNAWTASAKAPWSKDGCSQFVFWGDATEGADPAGGTIAARNMDGENDLRKLTVNLFMVHAVDPAESGLRRYAHVMWPGFVGASSGVNEAGRYLMENAGCSPPGPPADQMPVLRDVISSVLLDGSLPANATAAAVEKVILGHASAAGGSCVNGCILMSAEPHAADGRPAGFVYEGDRYGGMMRTPAEVAPAVANGIAATNHYWVYKTGGELHPEMCDGATSSFSSLARYWTARNRIEAWMRRGNGTLRGIGVPQVIELLQATAHGTTEHSVVFLPARRELHVAVAAANGVWDAQYRPYRTLHFADLFAR